MKTKIIAAATVVVLSAGGAWANQCGLNGPQIRNGWTCVEDSIDAGKVTRVSTERLGVSPNCAVYSSDLTQTVWYSVNPAGNIAEDRTVYGEITEGPEYRDGAARCQ